MFTGSSVPRFEDKSLLTGQGRFVDDLSTPDTLYAAFLRSPYAHARIESVDLNPALRAGAVAVFKAEDLGDAWREFPVSMSGSSFRPRNIVPMAKGKIRYVGEPLAVVFAESRAAAEDAIDAVHVSYKMLSAVADPVEALKEGVPLVHDDLGDNRAAHLEIRMGNVDSALRRAPWRLTLELKVARAGGGAMETRGHFVFYDRRSERLTVYSSTQAPHLLRRLLSEVLDRPESLMDVIAPDVGGGFGPKAYPYPEDVVLAWAAIKLGRPVKWVGDRLESLLADVQEREQVHAIEVGFDEQGRVLALRDRAVCDAGAYVPWGFVVPIVTLTGIPGPYKIPNYEAIMEVAYTHRVPVAPVRGAGRPQAVFVMERTMDRIARVLNIDPAEVRHRNLILPHEFPYKVGIPGQEGNILTYDSGDYPALLNKALDEIGYDELREGNWDSLKNTGSKGNRGLGIGISINTEQTGLGPFEGAVVRVDPVGKLILATGSAPQGQGHKTVLAQVLADALNITPEDVTVLTGDTRNIPYGIGTFASRTAVTAANSVWRAGEALKKKILDYGAAHLEAPIEDLEIRGGQVAVRGSPERFATFGELAKIAAGEPGVMMSDRSPGLEAMDFYTPDLRATAAGVHVCVVEVDRETGFLKVLRYVVAHDCGRMINPKIVEGQIRGGVVHGIGNAFIEEVVFDENAAPLASTFLDYLLPTATDVPDIQTVHFETPSPFNPLGVKGVGESGTIGALAAVVGAVEDALRSADIEINESPVTPYRLWSLLGERQVQ